MNLEFLSESSISCGTTQIDNMCTYNLIHMACMHGFGTNLFLYKISSFLPLEEIKKNYLYEQY